ncbi:hypothetical protein AB0A74_05545 [Saccharothrix sp. NPDC042600]|uniref:hypothetical protein n=1 Tax=Saccharothrix TaxID=2071 RepID=UPI0033C891A0|nr:hypothetical protein GCM10017745_05700 [Saccharothrix mutabilis subsp. capreolus]
MSDLRALHDAFGELERRADAVTAGLSPDVPPRAKSRLVPAAVAAVVVAGLATATALLVPDDDPVGQQAAGSTTTVQTTPTSTTAAPEKAPETPEELITRFKAVLGGTATFTVTESGPGVYRMTMPPLPPNVPRPTDVSQGTGEPAGAALVGQLTADGVTGGYDLVVYPDNDPVRQPAQCDLADTPDCTTRTLPDGSTLATDRTPLVGGGVTHLARLHRADGLSITIHVSNRQNPKGMGGLTGDRPPLTVDRLVEIVTSDLW